MRLELSNRTGLARAAMIVLAGHGPTTMKGHDLAREIGTTRTYLPQVVAAIVDHGWVASEPGPTGGYRIAPAASRATMFDLIEAIEGPILHGRCVLQGSPCNDLDPCAIHDIWSRTRAAMIAELQAEPVLPPEAAGATPV